MRPFPAAGRFDVALVQLGANGVMTRGTRAQIQTGEVREISRFRSFPIRSAAERFLGSDRRPLPPPAIVKHFAEFKSRESDRDGVFVERAADTLDCAGIDAKPFSYLAHALC